MVDNAPTACYNPAMSIQRESVAVPPLSDLVVTTPGSLRFREHLLDGELINSPQAMAQRVECELIKNLRETAPWMMPLILMS